MVSFVLFLALGYLTRYQAVIESDIAFSRVFALYRPGWLVIFMKGITWVGFPIGGLIIPAITEIALIVYKRYREALFLLLTMVIIPVSDIFKALFGRPRPVTGQIGFNPVASMGASFPSGHAAFSAAVYGFIIFLVWNLIPGRKKILLSIVLGALILSVAKSRIYLGAHFFTDIIGGLLLGFVWTAVLWLIYIKTNRLPSTTLTSSAVKP